MNDESNEIDGVDDNDPCLLFVSNIALKTMKMKHDKWMKMMATDEYRVSVKNHSYRNARAYGNSIRPIYHNVSILWFPMDLHECFQVNDEVLNAYKGTESMKPIQSTIISDHSTTFELLNLCSLEGAKL